MSLSYRPYSDQGAPHFAEEPPGTFAIRIAPGERGRWLVTPDLALRAGQSLVLSGELGAALEGGEAEVVVVFWRDEPGLVLHSTRRAAALAGERPFTAFAYAFAVPPGVKGLRVDVRAWTGAGRAAVRGLALAEPDAPPEPPEPEPETGLPLPALPGERPLRPLSGYAWGDNIFLVLHPPPPEHDT